VASELPRKRLDLNSIINKVVKTVPALARFKHSQRCARLNVLNECDLGSGESRVPNDDMVSLLVFLDLHCHSVRSHGVLHLAHLANALPMRRLVRDVSVRCLSEAIRHENESNQSSPDQAFHYVQPNVEVRGAEPRFSAERPS